MSKGLLEGKNMSAQRKRDRFILQAGILAAAGIICRIIGILYRSPLTSIIGDEGNGYYSTAYNIYTIILLVSSYSIPSAISKVIAGKLALKEYKNAHRVFHCALLYVVIIGGAASLFAFFGAPILVQGNSIPVLRVFAPTIFLSGLLGVFRGYFQAHRTMMPTSVSQIVEQILNASVSIGAALWFTSLVETGSDTTRAVYGAAGSAIGTGSGVLIALLFMLFIYGINRKLIHNRIKRDEMRQAEPYRDIFKVILCIVTPIVLSTFIYNLSISLNQTIYTTMLSFIKEVEESEIATMYGIFAGKAVVISNIPIALASAMSAAMIPTISASFATGNKKEARGKVSQAIRTTMLISIPSAVGLIVLARPVMQLLFPQPASLEQASALLRVLGITVVFYALSTLTNAVLQAIGRVNLPVINAAVSLAVQTMALVLMLLYTNLNLYALAFAMILYSFLMCLLNGWSVKKSLSYKQEMTKTFVLPFLAAVLMGFACFFVYRGLYYLLPMNVPALLLSILVGAAVYFAAVMALGAVEEEDLKRLPRGHLLIALGRKCYLLKSEGQVEAERVERAARQKRRQAEKKAVSGGKKKDAGKKAVTKKRNSVTGGDSAKKKRSVTGKKAVPKKKSTAEKKGGTAKKKPPVAEKKSTGERSRYDTGDGD